MKVTGALLREDSHRRVFHDSHHRCRSQLMSNANDKVKDGIHDAAEKTKDTAHKGGMATIRDKLGHLRF